MNYSSESALITGLFDEDSTGGTAADRACMILSPDDFTEESCRTVFRAIAELRKRGETVDIPSVAAVMLGMKLPDDHAIPWLLDATDGSPLCSAGWVDRYANRIKAEARTRKIKAVISLAADQVSGGETVGNVKAHLVGEIERIESEKRLSEDQAIGDGVMDTLNAMADRLAGDESKRGLRTGISGLDHLTGGIQPGEFWIAGAMPGRGKTALALEIALEVAGSGYPVFFVSLEMSRSAVVRRILKMKFGARMVENPNPAEWQQILEYAADLKTLPLYINESASLEATEIAQHARTMIARHGIRLIFVDYLQIVRGPGRDRRERTGDAANVLRALAKDTGVPLIGLSQLRRPENLNARPTMIDLKESGDLESHANAVLLIYMPLNDDGSFTGEDEIIIGKQREGPTGSVPVCFLRSNVRFHDREIIR